MRNFTKLVLFLVFITGSHSLSYSQSILNPADPVVNYDSAHPPALPGWDQIGKWVRTPRLPWNTTAYKSYIYKGVAFRLLYPKTYNPTANDGKKYPMIVFWHGLGEASTIHDNEFQMLWGGEMFKDAVANGTYDGYVIYMQTLLSNGGWFTPGHFQYMRELIEYMVANNKLDRFRVISHGLSAGGVASIDMFLSDPTYVASVNAMSAPGLYNSSAVIDKIKYSPFWYANGGLDDNPAPYTADVNTAAMEAAGANFRRKFYPQQDHGTWLQTWVEPDFWPFINRAYASNPYPLFGKYQIPPGEPVNVTIGLPAGYNGYQWRKDDVVIPGATGNTIVATQLGKYDARVLKGTTWSEWSPIPVVLSVLPPPTTPVRVEAESYATMLGIGTEVCSDLGGGLDVGWMEPNDYMEYPIKIYQAGLYTIKFRVAAWANGAQFQLRKQDGTVLTTVNVPNTNGGQSWTTVTAQINLPAGNQIIRFVSTGPVGWNINWWEYNLASGAPVNQVPTVNAGTDQTISLPLNNATLTGTATDADGTIASYLWTKISGPSGGTIATSGSASTAINGLTAGTYVYRLTVTDNLGATNFDEVQVVVNTASNQSPTVNAGTDQSITLPVSTTSLTGSASDPDGTISTYAWTKISGPAGGTISTPSNASTGITALGAGTYLYRLTVTDNSGATAFDEVQVVVNPAPPTTGPSFRIEAENYTTMSGVQTETTYDPTGGGLNVGWIDNGDWMDYSINPANTGTYNVSFRIATEMQGAQLQIRKSDGTILKTVGIPYTAGYQTWQTVNSTVNLTAGAQTIRIISVQNAFWNINWMEFAFSGTITNQNPTVNAGTDQSITLPVNSVNLQGTASDADGTVATYAWTKVSGPAGGSITTPGAASTSITGLTQGTYIFRLSVTDNSGGSAFDEVQVIVNPEPTLTYTRIQAESYASMTGVTLQTTTDAGAGQNVTAIDLNDWMNYTVNLPAAGVYSIRLRVAASVAGGQVQIKKTDGTVLATLNIPNTGGTQTWQTISTTITVISGSQTIRFQSSATPRWNFNWWEYALQTASPNQLPIVNAGTDKSITLPTNSVGLTGSASDSDGSVSSTIWTKISGPAGGTLSAPNSLSTNVTGLTQGTYVFRLTATDNLNGVTSDDVQVIVNPEQVVTSSFRVESESYIAMNGVQTETTYDPMGGGLNVGWIDQGDWMDYSINPSTTGTYNLTLRIATEMQGAQLQFRKADGTVLQTVNIPYTAGYQTWRSTTSTIFLQAGPQVIRVISVQPAFWNINFMEFTLATTGAGEASPVTMARATTEVLPDAHTSTSVYPNPVLDRASLRINNPYKGNVHVAVIGVNGAVLKAFSFNKTASGMQQYELAVGSLPRGQYMLRISMKEGTEIRRIIKQ